MVQNSRKFIQCFDPVDIKIV